MCGLVGCCSNGAVDISREILKTMSDTLTHRGPDDNGLYISPKKDVGLAHTRLSIIDLSESGHQPMSNEDKSIWIVYNGEIYNYQSIKSDLQELGHIFQGNSDTEVIIHAYEEYGIDCLQTFNGMFAFAVYDSNRRRIFIARDRFGIKPIYYGFLTDKVFVFASELKALAVHPSFTKQINFGALGDYFKYRYIPSPKSIWRDIYKLPQGHWAELDTSTFRFNTHRYYSLAERVQNATNSTVEEVAYNFKKAVKERLVADVEVGTLLSGGIDSSSISAITNELKSDVTAFSIGFEPEEYSELTYSKIVSDYLNINHIFEVVKHLDDDIVEKVVRSFDEPLADSSCIPTYILSEIVSKYVKVVLSGDGGDEVFSGYNWYHNYFRDYRNYKSTLISRIKDFVGIRNNVIPNFETYYNSLLLNRFDTVSFKKVFMPDTYDLVMKNFESVFRNYTDSPFSGVRAVQFVDLNTFMVDDILVKVDRASMANSVEVRVPLLDHNLVESIFRLDEKDYSSDSVDKPVLKKIVKGKLPEEILTRDKKGFSAPITEWIDFGRLAKISLDGDTVKDGIFNKDFILELVENRCPNCLGMLWMIFMFEKWYQRWYLNNDYNN